MNCLTCSHLASGRQVLMSTRKFVSISCTSNSDGNDRVKSDGIRSGDKMSAVDAVRRTCEETSSKLRNGPPRSSNLVMGSHSGEEDFRKMDLRVNSYPDVRFFTAIGTGGSHFAQSMREATEKVLGPIHEECVVETPSSKGKYVSVRVGPVTVHSGEQVIQVYSNMRSDPRLKMYL